jgi:hypothetical protein
MNQVEWYYARNNKQAGPVSAVELRHLAAAGELSPDDLVWREGMTEWSAARNVRGLFEEEGRAGGLETGQAAAPATRVPDAAQDADEPAAASPLASRRPWPLRHPVDVMLDRLREVFDARCVEPPAKSLQACGSYGLLVAAVLEAVLAVIAATKDSPLRHLLLGVVGVLAMLALQYIAGRFCDAADKLNDATTGSLSSPVLPNGLAVLSMTAGIVALLGSIGIAVEDAQYESLLFGVAAFLGFEYLAVVALNPAALRISIVSEPPSGGEAIGAVVFLLKAALQLVPVAFGTGVLCGVLLLGYDCCQSLADKPGDAFVAWSILVYSALLPAAAYLVFLLGNLVTNLWRSVLSLPPKLDKLAEPPEEQKS